MLPAPSLPPSIPGPGLPYILAEAFLWVPQCPAIRLIKDLLNCTEGTGKGQMNIIVWKFMLPHGSSHDWAGAADCVEEEAVIWGSWTCFSGIHVRIAANWYQPSNV